MIAAQRTSATLRYACRQNSSSTRNAHTSAAFRQEASTSTSTGSALTARLDALTALRKKVEERGNRSGGSRDGQQRRPQPQSASRDGLSRPRRDNDSREGGRYRSDDRRRDGRVQGRPNNARSSSGQRRSDGSGRGGHRGGGLARRSDRDDFELKVAPTSIHSIVPVTNWQHSLNRVAQGINRVPYKTPEVTIESVRKSEAFDAKTYKPLYQAERALKLHFASRGVKMGPLQSPTLTARPRGRLDDAPVPARGSEGGSIATEAREARVKLLQEKSGGDYQRWEIKDLAKSIRQAGVVPAEVHAAEAVTHNDDLGPSNKLWTVDTVKKILNRNNAS